MNRLYGLRFKRLLSSEEAWYDHNRYGGRVLILASVPVAALGVSALLLSPPWLIAVAFAPLLYFVPAVRIYRYAHSSP